jgi:hypothetical protein
LGRLVVLGHHRYHGNYYVHLFHMFAGIHVSKSGTIETNSGVGLVKNVGGK